MTTSSDFVLYIVFCAIVITVAVKWVDIQERLNPGDAVPDRPTPVVLTASQELLLDEIYAATADFVRRAKAKGMVPPREMKARGEPGLMGWELIEDGWPLVGANGVPYRYDDQQLTMAPLRDPARCGFNVVEGVGPYKAVLDRTLARKGVRPQPRRKKPSADPKPQQSQDVTRRPPPKSDDEYLPHRRDGGFY
ncbi:hypothetical protein ACFVUN_23120 [Kitasatospora griseola]|uniref:hypothetical protein n=1 Tax=Kitasatospora griseola TaxID=2064 RepID=UPI0036DB1B84